MPDEEVVWRVADDGVAWITLNRPDAGNSITWEMRDRLTELFEQASASLHVRAVVLTGTGDRHFCTGAALGGGAATAAAAERPPDAPERASGEVARLIRRGWQRLIASIQDCDKPVLASVNGTAAGGGAHLVLASDLVMMAEEAKLIEIFVRRGIIPDGGGGYLLPRIVGMHRAKELMFLGDDVPAVAAERIGIANWVVPRSELAKATEELAGRLASGPTRAIALTKWLVNRSLESSRHTAFEEGSYAVELVNATEDSGEGVASFMERRPPNFRGW